MSSGTLLEQGVHDMHISYAFPGGLRGEYYQDAFLGNLALTRIDRVVNFTWALGDVLPGSVDYLSVRWSGLLKTDTVVNGLVYFRVITDGNIRLWVEGNLVIDHWHSRRTDKEPAHPVSLASNHLYEIALEYRHSTGFANIAFMWGSTASKLAVVPMSAFYSLNEVSGSPVPITIRSQSTYAATTECTGDGLHDAVAGVPSGFSFCPRDMYLNMRDDDDEIFLTTELYGATLTMTTDSLHDGVGAEIVWPTLTYEHDSHCVSGRYTINRAGVYRLDLWHQNRADMSVSPLAGSPFTVTVAVAATSGPYSDVIGLPKPLLIEAGHCSHFTIVARDVFRNLRFLGGDSYELSVRHIELGPPTRDEQGAALFSNAGNWQWKYGNVVDFANGTYSAEICPVVAGWYDVHVLLYGPKTRRGLLAPRQVGGGSSGFARIGREDANLGQEVHDGPHRLYVSHTKPSATTTSVVPSNRTGLDFAIVGIPTSFLITVRDSWGNTVTTRFHPFKVTAVLTKSPNAIANVYDLTNGSFVIEYIAVLTGENLVAVMVDGVHIKNSPFAVPVTDGATSNINSFASGPGLHIGTAGVVSYFQVFAYDIDNNRKSTTDDLYVFQAAGSDITSNHLSGSMLPCAEQYTGENAIYRDLACGGDMAPGHYFGTFLPTVAENITVSVSFIRPGGTPLALGNSPFTVKIFPSEIVCANHTIVTGTLYDVIAGEVNTVHLITKDLYGNDLLHGGKFIEVAALGVSGSWGVEFPRDSLASPPGPPNEYHYTGFYSGRSDYYGILSDQKDGSYSIAYSTNKTGVYVLRIAMAEMGLNATYFNTTDFGYLVDLNFNEKEFERSRHGAPVNKRTTVSWTGDIGGVPGVKGDIGHGSYFHRFKTRVEPQIRFNLSHLSFPWKPLEFWNASMNEKELLSETDNAFTRAEKYTDQYFSVRWMGMIIPKFAERYNFTALLDPYSSLLVRIGGVGLMTNGTHPGDIVLNLTDSSSGQGLFTFTDTLPREFLVEYSHHRQGESHLALLWESPSTPRAVVPKTAFFRWTNITHRNLTTHPAKLSPYHSTTYGADGSLSEATVGIERSFLVYGRDRFGNLVERGGDNPTLIAVGPDGVGFRGQVTDYGNSTYLIQYYATVAGLFRLYVTIGCCPPHPNVGISAELDMVRDLLVSGAPYLLNVSAAKVTPGRSIAVGIGLTGTTAGVVASFNVLFRDLHNNPTTSVTSSTNVTFAVHFYDTTTGFEVAYSSLNATYSASGILAEYRILTAGVYHMVVLLNDTAIVGSPFYNVINPSTAFASSIVCSGLGLQQAVTNQPTLFRMQMFDVYQNPLVVGGNKFYVRLVGVDWRHNTVVPVCEDLLNGVYICRYTPTFPGKHELRVKLLKGSSSGPGGNGLIGVYDLHPFLASGVSGQTASVTVRDKQLLFSWPGGFGAAVINKLASDLASLAGSSVPISRADAWPSMAMSVRWSGHLVTPINGIFQLSIATDYFNATVYLDEVLVFDSATGLTSHVHCVKDSTHELVITAEAIVDMNSEAPKEPTYFKFLWATEQMRATPVPSIFLFEAAQDIHLSPFPVVIT